MRLLTIIFTFISFGLIAQTGSINFSVGRSKVTDTATVTMPSGYGGLRFKNQASQTKWQFTNDGTNWYRLIGGNISNNYVPKFNSTTGMLANSQIFDNGTEVGIGTASPTSGNKAHIFGNLLVANTGANAERWIEVQGGGAANNFGLKLNGRKAVYTTTSGPTVTYFADNDTESMFLQSGNLTLGRTGENAIRYMNILGGGAANNFGIQLNGRYSMWANTATAPSRLSIGFNGTEAIGITSSNLTDVQGTFAIRGGSPGTFKFLKSDSDGDATWAAIGDGYTNTVAWWSGDEFINSSQQFTYDGHTANINDGGSPGLALFQASDNPGNFTILQAPKGIVSDVTPSQLFISGGPAYTVGNNEGGDVVITSGAGSGSGTGGEVYIGGTGSGSTKGKVIIGDDASTSVNDIQITGEVGIAFNGGIGDGSAVKHKRCNIVALGAGLSSTCSITWDNAFADSNYTVTVSAQSTDIGYSGITAKSSTGITVKVTNPTAGSLTYTVNAIAMHD